MELPLFIGSSVMGLKDSINSTLRAVSLGDDTFALGEANSGMINHSSIGKVMTNIQRIVVIVYWFSSNNFRIKINLIAQRRKKLLQLLQKKVRHCVKKIRHQSL